MGTRPRPRAATLLLFAGLLAPACRSVAAQPDLPSGSALVALDPPSAGAPAGASAAPKKANGASSTSSAKEQPATKQAKAPAPYPHYDWFARAGLTGWVYDVGLPDDYGYVYSLGRRLGPDGWFVQFELSDAYATAEERAKRFGRWRNVTQRGSIYTYLVEGGKEFPLGNGDRFRFRVHGGVGWFAASGLGQDDEGFAATLGAAVEVRIHKTLWLRLGAADYGMQTNLNRRRGRFRNNLGADLSFVLDF